MNKTNALKFFEQMFDDILMNFNVNMISHYFKKNYIQITDGKKSDIKAFENHLITLKGLVKSINMSPFHDFIYDTDQEIATLRYTVNVEKNDGSTGNIEVIAIFELKDNKILRCNEVTSPIEDDESLKELGSIKS